jgi:hypothetical protein
VLGSAGSRQFLCTFIARRAENALNRFHVKDLKIRKHSARYPPLDQWIEDPRTSLIFMIDQSEKAGTAAVPMGVQRLVGSPRIDND